MKIQLVDVYRPGAPTTSGKVRDVRLQRIRRTEAQYLVQTLKLATWRGRKRDAITWTLPVKPLVMFIGLMRYQERAPMAASDSRTFSTHAGNPWKGVRHVRNESYTAEADELMASVHAPSEEFGNRDPLEVLFRSLIRYRRTQATAREAEPERFRRFPIQRQEAAA